MSPKAKNILFLIVAGIATAMLLVSAVFKFMAPPDLVKHFTEIGMGGIFTYLGCAEILFLILFWIPKVRGLGFALLTAYLGGAMATELTHQGAVAGPMMILALFWIAMFIKKPTTFFE